MLSPAHTHAFEDGITATPLTSNTYTAEVRSEWAIGDVPHGGYLTAIVYRLACDYLHKRHTLEASPITLQLTFVRHTTASILQPCLLGDSLPLRNRICMGSMTRNRCVDDNKPTEASIVHYATRARDGAGLIVAEGTFIHLNGAGWPHAPLMSNSAHAQAWKQVTDAVHREEGKMFFQPWHPGRVQIENMAMLKESGQPVLAPPKLQAKGGKFRLLEGAPLSGSVGHTANITEIEDPGQIVEQAWASVKLAKSAGFDGIELLSQGGYLLHNFLCSHSNTRGDHYGGSTENRCRFVLEVVDAICDVWSPRRVGIKICPSDDYNDSAVSYDELFKMYNHLITELFARGIAYPRPPGKELPLDFDPVDCFGDLIKNPGSKTLLMVNHE
ncbi:flavoprotein NADH-dependent oxidoreductase [Plectosphaerella cucumerina]|uniref:Flavoprotein NADH-dependent oxidoreductase n=1 Tax=Plectosphaerella cucumerina TaxID=40658 RepID=A0A8K0TG27_9PEZI|nr:flavoprotein NADH-dependent oxidoreductase [Plectosphaerella cucumerina]